MLLFVFKKLNLEAKVLKCLMRDGLLTLKCFFPLAKSFIFPSQRRFNMSHINTKDGVEVTDRR